MNSIIFFIFFSVSWIFLFFFKFDTAYLETLKLPFFMPPLFIWKIVDIIVILSNIFLVIKLFIKKEMNSAIFKENMIVYLLNIAFVITLFFFQNIGLSAILMIFIFIDSISYYGEVAKVNDKDTIFLNIYVLWCLYLAASIATLYLLNS